MELLRRLIDVLKHLRELDTLQAYVASMGAGHFAAIVATILFCETGLVVMPFLPGDSMLFAVGTVGAGANAPYNLLALGPALVLAVLLGDNVNYWLGRKLGPRVFSREDSKLLNRKHLVRTQQFYDDYGAKTIILARFVPIVRTFAPFVAGIGRMNYARFLAFSVGGAIGWVATCLAAGYFLANVGFVRKHFEVVALAIVVISVLPMGVEWWRHRGGRASRGARSELG